MVGTLKRGFAVGLQTTWTLGKVIFPVTLIVTLLRYTPLLDWLIQVITPLMGLMGLSGEAAIPLVIGNFLNLYAAIGAILTLDLTVKEVFILAVMLSFSHNLIIESTVAAKVGIKIWIVVTVRLFLAFLSAFIINLVWNGGGELAQYGLITKTDEPVTGWFNILVEAIEKASLGIVQLVIIVIPLMIAIQVLKDLQWLSVFSKWMAPITRLLGMKENTSTTLAAGILFGLAYGAGVMIQAVKEDNVSKKDLTLAFIFLVSCHAVIEDTLIFLPLGIPVLPLLLIRLVVAILLTIAVAFIWKRAQHTSRKEASYEN
ncbi:nucleoside recognition domain-containing protein [Cytobacillus sp. S13-E01]|uniref:nucleoside recognition domain-containing protein n=1 Tax=Cytobacillus sp. S13-E01 TaxID=3031326 RepID=UPI0023D8C50A|nr:nucleoside recognition domain-containing protein [Cytobacillus sp. S13-E01]MDF0728283.1 nucleoside recognition domain-containing protein [Cytobacillus sp. S13-E01]